jgi:polysaccharide biosynthesis protein PslA
MIQKPPTKANDLVEPCRALEGVEALATSPSFDQKIAGGMRPISDGRMASPYREQSAKAESIQAHAQPHVLVQPADAPAELASKSYPTIDVPTQSNSKERHRLRLYIGLLVLDVGFISIAFLVANYIRFGDLLAAPGLRCIPLTALLYIILAFSGRAYSIEVLLSSMTSMKRAMRSLTFAGAALLVVFFTLKASADLSRAVLAGGFVLGIVLLGLERYLFGRAAGRRSEDFLREVLIIDGAAVVPKRGQIVFFAERSDLSPFSNSPQAHDRLGRFLKNCDRIILACESAKRSIWVQALKGVGVPIEVLIPELDELGALSVRSCAGQTCVLVAPGPLGLRARMLKRSLDLAISVPALLILSPALVAAALAIKLTSPGPVLFRQLRIGQANRQFNVLKFRSMRQDTMNAAGTQSASKDDARITPVGRFLRRTSMDELPQLLNVLMGDMSIVGPRPHALGSTAEELLFWEIDERYWQRGSVKPGMTGLAQIRGFRGATHRTEDLTTRLHADLEYLARWSIWNDLAIIAKTARVLIHPNAY